MQIISEKIPLESLKDLAKASFGNLIKAVIDTEKGIMAIGGDLHSDEEALLLENGSLQKNLWGINIYPLQQGPELSRGNNSRSVENPETQKQIFDIVSKLIIR
jgi:hypothetical protein